MGQKVVVLGGGMIGAAMAFDLKADPSIEVSVADVDRERLERLERQLGIAGRVADLSQPEAVKELALDSHLVLGALPSSLGLRALRAVIEARRNVCDVSFMPEDPLELDALAAEHGVCAVVDCGVAPGLSHLMAGWASNRLDPCESVRIYVGGVPVERRWPFEYKAGFSPHDVIEEYVRPARVVEDGRVVVKEALSEPELVEFPGVGALEAVNTDGLRTLVATLRAREMHEKTLRYPGHFALMRAFRETGFFSKEPLRVSGGSVRPLDVTAQLLSRQWAYADGEADLTVMRVRVEGRREGRRIAYTWDLLDTRDAETGLRSMSRTTAFVATAVARRLLSRDLSGQPGVLPPEVLGARTGFLHGILADLAARGIHVSFKEEPLEAAKAPRSGPQDRPAR